MFFGDPRGRFRTRIGPMNAFRAAAKHRFSREILQFGWIMDRPPVFQSIGLVSNSFCDLTTRIESHGRETHTQNTVLSNEFTDFEKFTIEHRSRPKTISCSISAKHPGTGITLQLTALRVMFGGARASQPEPPAGPEK